MASGTLARDTEAVVAAAESITAAAAAEKPEKVESSARTGESRAWDAKAQID